jgi:hypothetical protein
MVVLNREAVAEVSTLRQKLSKVGAVVQTSVRRIWFHFSETWPPRRLFVQVYQAVGSFVAQLRGEDAGVLPGVAVLPLK